MAWLVVTYTLEQLIEALGESPLRLNNLFEREDGTWQANLRYREKGDRAANAHDDMWGHEWGLGATPAEALLATMRKAGFEE